MVWHAACNIAGGLHPYVYPAWGHAILIEYLLDYASWSGADPKLAAAGTALIPALVEVIEAHKTPSDWLYGDLYYSTGSRGQMGGHADADGIMPTMSGHTGLALHRVGELQQNPRLIRAAWATGLSLAKVQQAEGNFIFRVHPQTGEVASPYTSNVMPVVRLWDALLDSTPAADNPHDTAEARAKLAESRRKAMDWMFAGPWKNLRWEGHYEDMANLAPYENLQWWDASLAVEYVLARPAEFPGRMPEALKIARWIEDQFVCWREEDVPNRGKRIPLVPNALEQYRCYQPIDAHAARALSLFLAVWRANGDESYRARARAMATSIARAQRDSGAIATWWWMGSTAGEGGETRMEFDPRNDWFRCMAYDASVLIKHAAELSEKPAGGGLASLGTLDGAFYRNTAVPGRAIAGGGLMWQIPGWMMETDFPYRKKPFDRELPFADAATLVRLLGGWEAPNLPPDRRNDDNDLVWRDEAGALHYRWNLLKERLDPYLSQGYELTLVMDNIPYALADPPQQGNHGQVAPPADPQEWYLFMREMCREIKRLYGEEATKRLRFRMGTEMQDQRRFTGTFEQYLAYYDFAAKAIKEELPGAAIGPFNRAMPDSPKDRAKSYTPGNVSLLGLARHCAEGRNTATGEIGGPIDFVARSFYYFSTLQPNGAIHNVHPDQRMPEFKHLWKSVEKISPRFAGIPREVHELGPHLQTEEGLYGKDTGARGAAQTLHTLIGLREIGANRLWHWGVFERISPDKTLLMSQGWLYSIFDRMRGGELFSPALSAAQDHGNTRKALLAVKPDEAILLVANWNVDRLENQADTLSVALPDGSWKPVGMLRFDESNSPPPWRFAGALPRRGGGRGFAGRWGGFGRRRNRWCRRGRRCRGCRRGWRRG
jgi:hypothetical protein